MDEKHIQVGNLVSWRPLPLFDSVIYGIITEKFGESGNIRYTVQHDKGSISFFHNSMLFRSLVKESE